MHMWVYSNCFKRDYKKKKDHFNINLLFFKKRDPKNIYPLPPMPDLEGYAKLFFYFMINFFHRLFFVDFGFLVFTFFLMFFFTKIFYVYGNFYNFFYAGWFTPWFVCMVHYYREYFKWCDLVLWKRFEGDLNHYRLFYFIYFFIFYFLFYYWIVFSIIYFFRFQSFVVFLFYLKYTFFYFI